MPKFGPKPGPGTPPALLLPFSVECKVGKKEKEKRERKEEGDIFVGTSPLC